jgi:signal peptidase
MNQKSKKILSIIVNVVVGVILIFVAFITVNIIASGGKGYTSLFGTAFVSVESNSMKGDGEDNFEKGDMLVIRVLSDEQKNDLQVGDIITFYDNINGTKALNTHRIVSVVSNGVYRTAGDNNVGDNGEVTWDSTYRYTDAIVGIYRGKVPVLGSVISFFHTTAGFFVCIVLPALLIVAYCAFNLVRAIRDSRKSEEHDKKQQLKEEILRELQAEGRLADGTTSEKSQDNGV